MSPLLSRPGHRLLRCPVCRLDLDAAPGVLVCRKGHSFDLARQGYVNLLRNRKRQPAASGDGPEQLRHRAAFLDAGHFDAVSTAIAEHVQQGGSRPWRILDGGSGTGHHLAKVAQTLPPGVACLGLDISRQAARQAARRWPALAFAVADLWTEWPVQDAAVDLVISIFAPKNFSEATRVLRPGGWLALAYPGRDHMIELRDSFGLMRRHEAAGRRYMEAIKRFVGPATVQRLRTRATLNDAAIRNAILMGPNARHIRPSVLDGAIDSMVVTFDLMLALARRN